MEYTEGGVPVFVMMPLESVDMVKTKAGKWALGLSLLKLKEGGVTGVMLDVWWGIVEKLQPQAYDWSAYDELITLVASAGLKLQAVMSFHQCGGNVGDDTYIPLPDWVVEESTANPDVFYKDQSGWRNPEYVSLGSDSLAVLGGRTPVQCYKDYMTSFRDHFAALLGDVIVEIQVGMGPCGELRYPSYPQSENQWTFPGIGELQCYDKNLVASLEAKAKSLGKPEWGKIPEDAGTYNLLPEETGFFRDEGTWATPYGQFFLEWYSEELIAHGDRILSVARGVFGKHDVRISAKITGIHWQYLTSSHAAEVTAGYFNTVNKDLNRPLLDTTSPVTIGQGRTTHHSTRDGYLPLARMFSKHDVIFNFTCMEMQDSDQEPKAKSSPEGLIEQVASACVKAGIRMAGENALNTYENEGYDQIVQTAPLQFGPGNPNAETLLSFTYLRLSPELFTESNWSTFTAFVDRMGLVSSGRVADIELVG